MILAIAAGALTGALHGASWPRLQIWQLAFVFLLPVLLVLPALKTLKQVLVMGLLAGMVSCCIGFSWISEVAVSFGGMPRFLSYFVTLGYSLIGQTQYLFFLAALWALHRKRVDVPVWVIAALYTLCDFFWPKIFCDTEGAMLLPWFSLAQMAEWNSVYGLNFLCVYASGLSLGLFKVLCPDFFYGGQNAVKRKKMFLSWGVHTGVYVLAVFLLHTWGASRIVELKDLQEKFPRSFRTSLIQANIGDADKLASEQGVHNAVGQVLGTYSRLSFESMAGPQRPDLIIWPETAYPFIYSHFKDRAANERGEARDRWIQQIMTEFPKDVSFLFGGYSRDVSASGERSREFNTAFLLVHPFELAGQYRKSILLAFGEYVPLGPFSEIVTKAIPAIGNFGRGQGPSVFEWSKAKLGPLICYESIAQDYARQTALQGAEVFVNLTNDSWFGDTSEPFSHLDLTVFRSIELRRPLLRATNTGISALIDITGEVMFPTPLFRAVSATYTVKVPEGLPETFVMRFGYAFLWGLTCLLALWGLFVRSLLR